jgi:hypothetical protein
METSRKRKGMSSKHIYSKKMKEKEEILINALTKTKSITLRICATIVTIVKVKLNWHLLVDIPQDPTIQVVCAKIAIWLSII